MPRILIIKTSSMGDVVHNLPMVTDIAQYIPGAQIDWAVEQAFADIPALHPKVSRVIPVALRRWRKRILSAAAWHEIKEMRRRLREYSYDTVLDSQGLLKSALLARFGVDGGGRIRGLDRRSAREPLAAQFYDQTFNVAKGRHAVLRNRELAARAFGYPMPQTPPDYGIKLDDSAVRSELLPKYIVCLHATSRDSKLWPEDNWIAFASQLASAGITPMLPWGNDQEQRRAQAIARQVKQAIVPPKTSLKQLALIMHHAQAVVGVDTGLVHLAVALGRPTVAIYIDSDPELTGVLGANPAHAINLGNKGEQIPVWKVLDALARMQVYSA